MHALRLANRGRTFEELILYANEAYKLKRIAYIHKVPNPWQVRREDGRVVGAWPTQKGFLDFVGVAHGGIAVAFDVKQTREKSWRLELLSDHQYEHLVRWDSLGGLAFVLIWFVRPHRFFRVPVPALRDAWATWKAGGPASLSIARLEEIALEVRPARSIPLDYLPEIRPEPKNPPSQEVNR